MKNKSKKPLVITSLLVLTLVVSIMFIFYAGETDRNKLLGVENQVSIQETEKADDIQQTLDVEEEKEVVVSDDITGIEEETKIENEEIKKDENTSVKESKQETHQTNTSTTNTSKQENKQPNTTKPEQTNVETTNNNSNQTVKPTESENPKQESPKNSGIWDIYGKTEYEYYNEPMYAWERVDFSLSKYGTMKAAYNACVEYASKNYEPYLNGEELFNCNSVLTASGKELGIMLVGEKLR